MASNDAALPAGGTAQLSSSAPPVEWSHMTRTLAHYEREEQIGEGTYGQVYRAKSLDTGRIVALKKIRVHHGGYWGMPPTVLREIKILKRLRHPRLVEMVEVVSSKGVEYLEENDAPPEEKQNKRNSKTDRIVDAREGYKGNLYLVLEYVSHDLTGLLDVAYRFTEVQVKCIFRQLLEALEYMHDNKYVHRDIKSSNILIDSHFRVKLADFGLARCIEPPLLDAFRERGSQLELTNKVITLWYRPPEILLGSTHYGFPVDIWSAGCILAELLLGKPLFTGKTEMDQLQLVFDLLGTPSADSWDGLNDLKLLRTGEVTIDKQRPPRLRDKYGHKLAGSALNLLEKLLELDPQKRLTANRALTSRYFLSEPRAPEHPEELGMLQLGEGGGHFHEFQTKKKRREAKVIAKQAVADALARGMSQKEADLEYDEVYRGCMKKVAEEGNSALIVQEDKKDEGFSPPIQDIRSKEETRGDRKRTSDRRDEREKRRTGEAESNGRHEKSERSHRSERKDERKDRSDRKRHREGDEDDDRRRRKRESLDKKRTGSGVAQTLESAPNDESQSMFKDHSWELFETKSSHHDVEEAKAKPAVDSPESERKRDRDPKKADGDDHKRGRSGRSSGEGGSRERDDSREHRRKSSRRDRDKDRDRERDKDRDRERDKDRDRDRDSSRRHKDKDRDRHRRSHKEDRHRRGERDRRESPPDRDRRGHSRDQARRGSSRDRDRDWRSVGPDERNWRGDREERMPVRGPDEWNVPPRDGPRGPDFYQGPPGRRGPPDGPPRRDWGGPPPPQGRFGRPPPDSMGRGPPDSMGRGPPDSMGRGPPPPGYRDEPPPPGYRDERDRRREPRGRGRGRDRARY